MSEWVLSLNTLEFIGIKQRKKHKKKQNSAKVKTWKKRRRGNKRKTRLSSNEKEFYLCKCIWMIKSIELDPYEEWYPCNSPEIVSFSQCHSENRRNHYRRKAGVQRPIGGKTSCFPIIIPYHKHARTARIHIHTHVKSDCPEFGESSANSQFVLFLIEINRLLYWTWPRQSLHFVPVRARCCLLSFRQYFSFIVFCPQKIE